MFKHAIPHRLSHVILKEKHQFEQKMLNSDLVVAIDLFYWNSVFLDEGKCDVDSVEKQLKQLKKTQGQLVLGEMPQLKSSQDAKCRNAINTVLRDGCIGKCLLLKEDEVIPTQGASEMFQSDGLHLSQSGSQYLADKICEQLFIRSN